MIKYTLEDVKKLVSDYIAENGTYPKRRDFKPENKLPNSAIFKRFNMTYKEFMELYYGRVNYTFWTKENIINTFKDFIDEHGRPPSYNERNELNFPDRKAIKHHFDLNYYEFMKEYLDVTVKEPFDFKEMSLSEFVELFKINFPKIEPAPVTSKEYDAVCNKNSLPVTSAIKVRYGLTYNELMKLSGFDINEKIEYSKEDVMREIIRVVNLLGHSPSCEEFELQSIMTRGPIRNYFGNYNNALKAAELDMHKTPVTVTESDEELLEMYKNFCAKIGKMATSSDLDSSEEIYRSDVFVIRFGNMYNLYKLAGFEPKYNSRCKYSKSEIAEMMLEAYIKKGCRLTNSEIKKSDQLPSISTILRYFKKTKMSEIWEEILKGENNGKNNS